MLYSIFKLAFNNESHLFYKFNIQKTFSYVAAKINDKISSLKINDNLIQSKKRDLISIYERFIPQILFLSLLDYLNVEKEAFITVNNENVNNNKNYLINDNAKNHVYKKEKEVIQRSIKNNNKTSNKNLLVETTLLNFFHKK